MKYNYIVSIFLLIFVVIISQTIYVHTNKKIVEGWWIFSRRRNNNNNAAVAALLAILLAAIRQRYLNFVAQFVNPRQTPYVNLLGQAYVNNRSQVNLTAYKEAGQVDALVSQTNSCNSDSEIGKIINLTSNILSGNAQNSTKVYFISEVIIKSLDHFYNYNIKNNETQFNYLIVQFPKTFKDDNDAKKKYVKFISLLALAHISKSTTLTSLPPNTNYFIEISKPIISEAQKIINELKKINYELSYDENNEIQRKYTTIVNN
jgi:hypothetical protein